jgi:Flp pilus assembly protein TadG
VSSLARDDQGLAVLYVALLVPTFLLLLALVVEIGTLRVTRARLVAAADLAATVAVGEQDLHALARDGRYHLAPGAAAVAREMLARELAPLAGRFSGATPEAIAASAEVAVGADEPTLRLAFSAPVRTPLFLLAALREATTLRISVTAAAR